MSGVDIEITDKFNSVDYKSDIASELNNAMLAVQSYAKHNNISNGFGSIDDLVNKGQLKTIQETQEQYNKGEFSGEEKEKIGKLLNRFNNAISNPDSVVGADEEAKNRLRQVKVQLDTPEGVMKAPVYETRPQDEAGQEAFERSQDAKLQEITEQMKKMGAPQESIDFIKKQMGAIKNPPNLPSGASAEYQEAVKGLKDCHPDCSLEDKENAKKQLGHIIQKQFQGLMGGGTVGRGGRQ